MKYIYIIILILFWLPCQGQTTFNDEIPLGRFKIGYSDTIIYNDSIVYNQFNYKGSAPIFIQIWHPLKKQPLKDCLTYGDFRKRTLPENLKQVYQELYAKSDTAFIDYNIAYTVPDETEINYGSSTLSEVLDSLKSYKTNSYYSVLSRKLDFPVIVYHHGSQSVAEENFVLAEYFASRGYIFISANFHLPYHNMAIGSAPFLSNLAFKNDQSSVKQLMLFARTITTSKNVFYIGHSWGAQSGWCFLHEKGWAEAFVSMETTLEDKKDTLKIKEMWPEMYEIIKRQRKSYSIPVLLFSGSVNNKTFDFFENPNNKEMIYASTKTPFTHNSYTSVFLMRYYFRSRFNQPDAQFLSEQINIYSSHLEMIHNFFESVEKNKEFDKSRFSDVFYIN